MNLSKVIDFDENQKHCYAEVICINCKHRWMAVYPQYTLLKSLECPKCHKQGYVIKTGETYK